MTSLTIPLRSQSQRVRPTRRARLLRLELRHSTMIWLLPLLGALFYFDAFRTAAGYPPFWFVRSSVILNHMVPDFSLFAAGVAAWTGSRNGRRRSMPHSREYCSGPSLKSSRCDMAGASRFRPSR